MPGIKAIAISSSADQAAYFLARVNIIARAYPLTRVISVVLYRAESEPIKPQLKEFLRFVLSAQGQAIIDKVSDYLPLNAKDAQRQLERLN